MITLVRYANTDEAGNSETWGENTLRNPKPFVSKVVSKEEEEKKK